MTVVAVLHTIALSAASELRIQLRRSGNSDRIEFQRDKDVGYRFYVSSDLREWRDVTAEISSQEDVTASLRIITLISSDHVRYYRAERVQYLSLSELSATTDSPVEGENGMTQAAHFRFTVNALGATLYIGKPLLSSILGQVTLGAIFNPGNGSANPVEVAGDTSEAFCIPAGTSRTFSLSGTFESEEKPSAKEVSIFGFFFGTRPDALTEFIVNHGLETLRVSVVL